MIPTLWAQLWQIKVADLPFQKMAILQYESSHLIPTLTAQMWQTRWQIYLLKSGEF